MNSDDFATTVVYKLEQLAYYQGYEIELGYAAASYYVRLVDGSGEVVYTVNARTIAEAVDKAYRWMMES